MSLIKHLWHSSIVAAAIFLIPSPSVLAQRSSEKEHNVGESTRLHTVLDLIIEKAVEDQEIADDWREKLDQFRSLREKYLLY